MRYSGTWLTPADEVILEQLREHGPANAAELAESESLAYRAAFVEQRCSLLAGRSQLVVFVEGRYRLTDRGRDYLDGELDPGELPRG